MESGEQAARAYDPALAEKVAAELGAALKAYLQDATERPSPTSSGGSPAELAALAQRRLRRQPPEWRERELPARARELAEEFLAHCRRLHSPHYIGHQVPAPAPIAGLFDGLGAAVNQPMAIFEMGPYASAIERAVGANLKTLVGWKDGEGDAVATHGGSLANLTALLAARNVRLPEFWKRGAASGAAPAIAAGADSHYSIARAAGVLGVGTERILKIAHDERRRMRPDALESALEKAEREGLA
ncbi:MAG TPA: pyridoxal-dependent decarboxylase, partial [Planctomycetia bacterium]|nr:pyridoxal-dependent decarboxylase [Planctomycetia bacterium]